MDRPYGIERAAALPGVHPATCRRRERQEKIRVLRTLGGKRRIPESEIWHLRGESLLTAREAGKHRMATLQGRIAATEKAIRKLFCARF